VLGELVGLILTQLDRWPQVNKECFDKLMIDGACVALSLGVMNFYLFSST
jgi:hypothetical protein